MKLNRKKIILVFIDWYLPGYKAGGPIRSCANLVDHLKDEFEFYVITRDNDYCETTPYSGIKSDSWNKFDNGTNVYYLSEERLSIRTIKEIVSALEFDIAYINGIYSYYFSIAPLRLMKKMGKPVVVATRGMLARSAINVKGGKKRLFLKIARFIGLYKNVVLHATTDSEIADIERELGKDVSIHLAPNLPRKINSVLTTDSKKNVGELKLVSVARIAPEKNLKYALQRLKEIKPSTGSIKPNIEFDIYGPVYDRQYWEECQSLIRELPETVTVKYKGSLRSEEIAAQLGDYHFLFMPTLGENFGHIILESMAVGCPVIISDQTPWKSLELKKAGWDIPLSNKGAFLEILENCVKMDHESYHLLSKGAIGIATKYINDSRIRDENIQLFLKA